MVRSKITPFLTVEKLNQTIAKGFNYRSPVFEGRSTRPKSGIIG
jgi:hypothetical protein